VRVLSVCECVCAWVCVCGCGGGGVGVCVAQVCEGGWACVSVCPEDQSPLFSSLLKETSTSTPFINSQRNKYSYSLPLINERTSTVTSFLSSKKQVQLLLMRRRNLSSPLARRASVGRHVIHVTKKQN
jgi:hypothetical protein